MIVVVKRSFQLFDAMKNLKYLTIKKYLTYLTDLSLSDAIASFFNINFVLQLRYLAEGEALALILLRRLANRVE